MNHPQRDKKRSLTSWVVLVLILAFALITWKNGRQRPVLFKKTAFYMDTFVQIVIKDLPSNRAAAEKAMDEALEIFRDLETDYNLYDRKSRLSTINVIIDGQVKDGRILEVLKTGIEFSRATGGSFDPTLGAVKLLYPFGEENPVPPDDNSIKEAMENSGYQKVRIEGTRVKKPKGLMFDLGGILKGYGVDRAAEMLRRRGYSDFLVNGGGNIRASGTNLQGIPWRIGVENPRAKDRVIGIITLSNQAVATSGDYQRYFFYDKVRYHHVLNPATGKPAQGAILATVVAPDAITADALSTAALVKGRTKGIKMLERMGMEGVIIDNEGISTTAGLAKVKFEK